MAEADKQLFFLFQFFCLLRSTGICQHLQPGNLGGQQVRILHFERWVFVIMTQSASGQEEVYGNVKPGPTDCIAS